MMQTLLGKPPMPTLAEYWQQHAVATDELAAVKVKLRDDPGDGPNDPVYLANREALNRLVDLIEWLETSAIPAAEKREAEEREAARTAEETQRAEALKRANKARFNGVQAKVGPLNKALSGKRDAMKARAESEATAENIVSEIFNTFPDDYPYDPFIWRAGRIVADITAEDTDQDIKERTSGFVPYARCLFVDGFPKPEPVVQAAPPAPAPKTEIFLTGGRSEIDRLARIVAGEGQRPLYQSVHGKVEPQPAPLPRWSGLGAPPPGYHGHDAATYVEHEYARAAHVEPALSDTSLNADEPERADVVQDQPAPIPAFDPDAPMLSAEQEMRAASRDLRASGHAWEPHNKD
jgi:hypothetical protein